MIKTDPVEQILSVFLILVALLALLAAIMRVWCTWDDDNHLCPHGVRYRKAYSGPDYWTWPNGICLKCHPEGK